MAARTGLLYLYTKDPDPVHIRRDAWFWTAVDIRTGQTVWKRLAGTRIDFDDHYAGIVIGRRNRTAYLGMVGGIRPDGGGGARRARASPAGRRRDRRVWRSRYLIHGAAVSCTSRAIAIASSASSRS